MKSLSLDVLKKWYAEHRQAILDDFIAFLKFPSVSTDPQYAKDMHNTAHWLAEYLKTMGLEATLWETPGFPVVFASYLKAGPDRPTLLIYHHYDVQPVDPLELWESPPFEPLVRDNQIYARGALDNKGQCFYSLTALKAVFALAKEIDINIKVFIEGEEESGGDGTKALIEQKKTQLQADHLLVVDFAIADPQTPAVTLGVRGIMTMQLTCSNSKVDLHSGEHGGIALNPNRALATLLAGLWDANGKIAVEHFYEGVRPLSQEDLASIDMRFDLEKYRSEFGVNAFSREQGYSILESNWLRPTLEINGMWGGYTGSGFKTVIPAKAFAKISCRLVPDQEPQWVAKRLADFLRSRAPSGIEIQIDSYHGALGYRSRSDSQIVNIAARAFSEVFQTPCRYQLCGASVPIVADLARVSHAQVALIGVGLPSDNIHAPNEHFGLDRFEKGFLTIARILCTLGEK